MNISDDLRVLRVAEEYVQNDRDEDAKAIYLNILKASRQYTAEVLFEVNNNLGISLLRTGLYAEALDCFNTALLISLKTNLTKLHDRGGVFFEPVYNKGVVFLRMQRYKQAIGAFEYCKDIAPKGMEYVVLFALVRCSPLMGDHHRALTECAVLLKYIPHDPLAKYLCAFSAYMCGRVVDGLRWVQEILANFEVDEGDVSGTDLKLEAMGLQVAILCEIGYTLFAKNFFDASLSRYLEAQTIASKMFQLDDVTLIDPPLCTQRRDADIAPAPLDNSLDTSESVAATIGQASQSSASISSGCVYPISLQELKARLHTIRFNVALVMLKSENALGSAVEFQKLCSCSDELSQKLAYSSYAGYGAALLMCAEPSVNKGLSEGAEVEDGIALLKGSIDAWIKAKNMCEASIPDTSAEDDVSQRLRIEYSMLTNWIFDVSSIVTELRGRQMKTRNTTNLHFACAGNGGKDILEACESVSINSISDLSGTESLFWSNDNNPVEVRRVEPRVKARIHALEVQKPQQVPLGIVAERRKSSPASACDGDLMHFRAIYAYDSLLYPGPYPEGVDVKAREMHLNDMEFASIFGGLSKDQFLKLPVWKQIDLKKKNKLF